jgi:hypothetical protein
MYDYYNTRLFTKQEEEEEEEEKEGENGEPPLYIVSQFLYQILGRVRLVTYVHSSTVAPHHPECRKRSRVLLDKMASSNLT